MTKFVIRTTLLEALQRFCMKSPAVNHSMTCIRIAADEIVACDGHRMVRMPVKPPPCERGDKCTVQDRLVGEVASPFLLPGDLVVAALVAGRALWNEWCCDELGEAHRTDFRVCESEITVDGSKVEITHDHCPDLVFSADVGDLAIYPDIAKLDGALTTEGAPCVARFNPALLEPVPALLDVSQDQRGINLHAWDVFASGSGPTEYRSHHGTRIAIMGMASTAAEVERGQRLQRAAMRGERPS